MASSISSLLLSPLSSTTVNNRELSSSSAYSLHSAKLLFTPKTGKSSARRCGFKSPVARKSLDHIPKQFREENLKDGLMENYKDAHEHLYGLSPSNLDMFMTAVGSQSGKVTEDTLTSSYNYSKYDGMGSLSGTDGRGPAGYSMSAASTMRRGGRRRPKRGPPDLPSILLHNRIVYLGLPLVPAVTELIVAQFVWLDYEGDRKPIYVYINSSGTQSMGGSMVGDEEDAYAIADAMTLCRSDVYTINTGMALGQAAMLLSLGKKGKRAVLPSSYTKLYLPQAPRTSGPVSDMWIKARDLDTKTKYFLEFLSRGTGKPQEELEKDLRRGKSLPPEKAIEYGLADTILYSMDTEKKDEAYSFNKDSARGARIASQKLSYGRW